MKGYFVVEARELASKNKKEFNKRFTSYKKQLQSRIETFEKHGKGNSKSAQRLREALYDMQQSKSIKAKTESFSKASLVMTSARGSYTRSLSVDRKIIAALNEQFGKYDESGKLTSPFITLKDFDDFVELLDIAKDSMLSAIYGSMQIIEIVRDIIQDAKDSDKSAKELLYEYIAGIGEDE